MKKDFYKKIFYIPLVVFFFLSITAFVFYINQQTTVIGDYSHPVPKRLDVIVDEIEKTLYDIVGSETGDDLFSEATSLMEDADCQYAKSLCREGDLFTTSGGLVEVRKCSSEDLEGDSSVIGSLWSSKAEERDFHTKQGQLKEEKEQLEFLQNILKKEMNHGIAKDIEQMRIQGMDDEADEVERELGILLFLLDPNDSETREILDDEIINEGETRLTDAGIDPSSESIIQILNKVVSISTEGGKALCAHACVNDYEHISFTFCFNLTEQSKIDLVFNIKLEIEDLEIDPIEIKEIVLSLPEEVEIPEVRLQFSIPIPDIIVEEDDISLKVDPYPKKGFYSEGIKLSCPEHENHSLSYEDVDIIEEINPTELKWYFELLEFLYNGCNDITSTLYNPIDANCYDIDSVISTIESKCSNAWNCPESGSCSCGEVDCTICENLYCYCGGTDCSSCTIKDAQADACAILFLEAGEDIPDECIPSIDYPTWPVDMLPVMENKCLEILEEEKTKDIEDQDDMPYECALVAIWKNDVEIYSDDYSESVGGGTVTLDEGKIGVLPDSFIGCNPPEIPSFPKIPLSDLNKEFSDIITPDFNFCPLIQVKLPDVTIEDLEFPDIELCNLQDCQDLLDYFPKFIDDLPALGRFSLEIPTIEIDPIEIDMIGDIEISPWEDRSLEFHMPQMPNLNPISLSEFIYEIPEIEIPKPELTFSFEELDADWLSIAIGWILNKIMADLPSGCITFEVTIGCLSIIFEDYHISWADFPEIPEIPACVTAQEFCRDSKEKLEEVIEVTNDIVDGIQSTIQDVLQIPGDAINDITNLVNEKVQEKEDEINDIIEGLIEDGEELIEIVDIDDIEIDISLTDIIDEIPEEITIPWEDLGIDPKIILLDPIEIEILPIPLSDMNVEVKLVIHIPFVQVMEPFSAGLGGSVCESDTDSLFVFQDFFDEEFDTKLELQVEDIINIIKN